MDRIRPTQASALVEALRRLSKARRGTGSVSIGPGDVTSTPGSTSLHEALGALAAGVDIEDEQALRAAQPQILRCILQHEWGDEASRDPAFAGILAAVDQAIATDPRLAAIMRDALKALQAGGAA